MQNTRYASVWPRWRKKGNSCVSASNNTLHILFSFFLAEKEKVSSVIDSATNEATALDPVTIWKRRTKYPNQAASRDVDVDDIGYDSDSS